MFFLVVWALQAFLPNFKNIFLRNYCYRVATALYLIKYKIIIFVSSGFFNMIFFLEMQYLFPKLL